MAITRRKFIQGSVAAGAAVALPASSWGRVLGANEEIRVACAGIRGRGGDHIRGLHSLPGVRVVALCDPDAKVLANRAQSFAKKNEKVDTYKDIRQVLERDDIDIVACATPNHWHALMAIWSMQAGKDVYLEKPVSHNVWEGRQIVRFARSLKKICATGTQSRSNPGLREAIEFVHKGELGKVKVVRGFCYKPRQSIGKVSGPQTVPDHIDYDLWRGPAPMVPLRRKNLHYDWHWVYDTGNGDVGNQGIHQMDMARWILQEDSLAPRVISVGGRVGYDDDGNTPNTQIVCHDYPSAPLIFEVRGLPKAKEFQAKGWGGNMPTYRGVRIGVVADCEGGSLIITSYAGGRAVDKDGKEIKKFSGAADHYANFIEAVKSRKHTDLTADIEEGHLSSALCHMGNVSHVLGQTKSGGEIREQLKNSSDALDSFERMAEHLKANEIALDDERLRLGASLQFDPKTERFIDNEAANKLLARNYRPPYVVPSEIG